MIPNQPPTGGTDPKVNVVEPLTNAPVKSQTTSTGLPVFNFDEPEEKTSSGLPVFNFDEEQSQTTEPVKQEYKKTPQELFARPEVSENTKIQQPLVKQEIYGWNQLNSKVNPKLVSNAGTISDNATGAQVVHKDGELKQLKIQNYPQDIYIDPSVQSSLFTFNSPDGKEIPDLDFNHAMNFLQANRIPTMSTMVPTVKEKFFNTISDDGQDMPTTGIVIPDVKKQDLKTTFSQLNDVDVKLNESISKNQESLNSLSQQMKDYEAKSKLDKTQEEFDKDKAGYENARLTYNDIVSKDIYFNIWKQFKDKSEVYPEEVSSQIQILRNQEKYKVLQSSGFVNAIDETLPDNVKNFLQSSEYINSTAKDKMLYAKMLWMTNRDKFPNANDLYSKIANTFTPSVKANFLKQKARELKPLAEKFANNSLENISPDSNPVTAFANLAEMKVAGKPLAILNEIIGSDFENESNVLGKVNNMLEYHGADAVPFVSTALELPNSVKLYQIVNKEKKSGIKSLTEEEKLLFDVTSMFNAYNDIAKPDKLTTAINGIPSFISFVGEMGIAGGAPAKFTQGLIKSTAKKGIEGAMKLSPELIGGSVDVLKSMDWLTNGAYTKLADNAVKVGTYLPSLFATTSAARGLEYTDNAIKMTTPAPDMYLDENNMKYINEVVDTGKPNFWSNMAHSILLESANVATMDVAKAVGNYQNSIALKLMNRFEKGSPGYKLLSLLEANNMERLAKEGGLQTGVDAFISRAQNLSPMSVVPDVVAFGGFLPPVEKAIQGEWKDYKDQLWKNPTKVLTSQVQDAAINLAVPILGGKLFGLPALVDFEKIIRPNESAFRDFQNVVFHTPYEDFIKSEFIKGLNAHINRFSETGDAKKDRFGEAMYSRLKDRLNFEQGKIAGAKGESYLEYTLNSIKSQNEMTSLLDDIKTGKVDGEKLNKSIENASDDFARQQFEFHRDLVNAYPTSASDGETMKEYVDKHKKEYNSIKQEFATLRSLTTKPDWSLYEKRINDLMMPQGYKDELKTVYDELKPSIEKDNEKLYGNKVGDVSNLQETIDLSHDNTIHKFTLDKESGSYKFTTNKPEDVDSDISFRLKSMSIPDVVNLYHASRNSDMTAEQKDKVGTSIKERALSEFEDNEFFSQFGGSENMGQLLDAINTVAQTNPLTPDEKQSLSNAVLNVFEIEIRRDETPENYDKVMSSVVNTIQKVGVVDLTGVLKFHQRAAKTRLKSVISRMSVQNLEDAIQTTSGEDGRGLLREEVNERKRTGQLTDKQLTELIDKLNLLPISQNLDFDTLRRNNKAVERISDKIYELSKPRKTVSKDGTVSYKEPLLSESSVSLVEQILCSQNHEFLHLNGVNIDYSDSKDNTSRYSEKSKTITISGNGKVSEADLVAEIIEEINHSVQHNIAISLANGGMIGDFILTDAQLTEICGQNRTDAIAAIAKWYKGKDYDYNRFLQLKDKLRSEMTDAEAQEFYAIKDMLKRFGIKYGQSWDNLRFKDTENKALQWEFTTESLVRNWNRYQEMRQAIRPGGLQYSAAQAFYYSAYAHEYFARTLGDYQIKDISAKLNDSPEVESMIDKTSNFLSKLKLPALMKAFRSKVFEGNTKPVTDMMSQADEKNLQEMVSTPGATFTEEQKKDFNNILKDVTPENPTDHFRSLIQDTGNPQRLNDFIIAIADNATKLGYDKGIANDIVMYLNKEINITGKDIQALRDNEVKYVSNTLKALESLKIEKTSSSNWLDKILSAGGKKVEIERYGLDEFLKREKSPTKQDILSFLADKVMKVKDVILGGEIDSEYARLNSIVEHNKNRIKNNYGFDYDDIEPFTNPGAPLNESALRDELNAIRERDKIPDDKNTVHNISDNGFFEILGYVKNIREARKDIYDNSEYRRSQMSKDAKDYLVKKFGIEADDYSHLVNENSTDQDIENWVDDLIEETEDQNIIDHRDEVVQNISTIANEVLVTKPTRWSQFTSFPLNNYRELLPVIDTDKKLFEHTSHFPGIQNQLYHNRLNDVTTVDGKKLLLSEEMQGDWTQKIKSDYEDSVLPKLNTPNFIEVTYKNGDKKIYTSYITLAKELGVYDENRFGDPETAKRIKDKFLEIGAKWKYNGVEKHERISPYTKTSDWVRAAIKRMIALAVSEGKDGIAWTPAHLQVERWNSSVRDVVDSITWTTKEDFVSNVKPENGDLYVAGWKNGLHKVSFLFHKQKDGSYRDNNENSIKDIFGSEIEKQILSNTEKGEVKDEKIIVGGQGYIDIYDKTAVDVANKIAKKYGLAVGKSEVETDEVSDIGGGDEGYISHDVHSLIFNEQLKEDIGKKNELEIFSKREQTPPTHTGEFKNIPDMIDNQMKLEKEKEIGSYRGIEGLKNLEKTNPEEYRRLYKLLQDAERNFKNPNDKSYYILNYLSNGWFREKLKGKEFYKSLIDDSKMEVLSSIPKYKSPSTAMLYDTVMKAIKGGDPNKERKILRNDVDELEKHNIYLDDIISHKELFDSYPTLRNAQVKFYWDEGVGSCYGFKSKDENENTVIGLNIARITSVPTKSTEFELFPEKERKLKSAESIMKDTIMHEVQHGIQEIEGFHMGADTDYFKDNFLLYNIAMAKNAGDKVIAELLQQPNNQYISTLVDKIDAGLLVSKKEYNPQKFTVARDLNNSYFQLLKYISEKPEYKWAYDVYRRVAGEIESFDVEQNKKGELPATLLLSLGETVKQLGYDQLIKPQDVISIEDSGKVVGAYREEDDKYITDVYEHQDRNAERLLEVSFKGNGGNYWKYKIENAGDILRELAKYKNDFVDPSYIFEKVNKIETFINNIMKGVHPDDSYESAVRENKDRLDLFRNAYEEQPVMSVAQEHARQLALAIVNGDMTKAKGEVEYFNTLRGDSYKDSKELLIQANDYTAKIEENRLLDNIGAKRKEESSPIDVAWFTSLFEDKDAIISGKEVERVVKDIDDNSMKYLSDTVTTLSEANRKASEYAHNLIELWKGRVIAKSLPKSSVYERKEIARLVNIPFRKKLQDYTKDINYITQIVENANFRKALSEVKQEQAFARNRFLRYNKDDVRFYSSVNKLTSVNTRMFDDIESLTEYRDLLSSKPEDVNIQEFNAKVDEVWNKYLDWKKQFNDQYTGAEESISDDETILKNQIFYEKKQIIKGAVATQLVNRGATKLDRDAIDVFSRVDIDAMDERQLKEYETALKYLLLNPESVNHKVIKIVNKYKAQEWYEEAANTLSSEYIDLINKKSLPSTGAISQYIKGLVPGVGKDKLGNISAFNVKSLLEIAEGMSTDLPGVLQSEITEPINKDYHNFLINKSNAIRKISAKGKFSISENHRIGIKALLSQKPQFSVSANALETLSQNGIDISDIAVGEVLSSVNSDPNKQAAYDYILKNANAMIKDSILISFGVKPDHEWSDIEMKEILGDVSVMSRRSEHQIKLELENLLKDSGVETLQELVDGIESGTHNLTDRESEYLETLRETMNGVKDGEYSDGLNLKDASEKLYGIQFQEIQDYFPLLRYKTYLTTEKYLDPEHNEDNDAKVFYGVYNDFQMNTSFLEKRKPTVMALQTNAYEAVAKRIDQQIFYLNHVENQNYLKSVFRTPAFYGKSDMFNTEATNQIVDLLNGNYNRGVNSARAEIMKDVSANFIYNAIQRYKALYVGDWLKAPGQLTTVIFNMAKMKGNALKKFTDVASGTRQMVSSYSEGTREQKFLEQYAPEIYYRGLNTYDFVGIESGDVYEEGDGSGFISEAKRNSGKVSGVVRGYERGIYRTNKSKLRNIASEIRNPYSSFGAEWNLAGLKFHDRVAARTSFFSSYKNYCDYLGVEASLTTPNQQALNYALESTRETQNTDNPLQKSGLSYNLIAGGSRQFPGDWAMVNLLAFKSYSINERQTLMKASQRLKNAIVEKNWSEAADEASYFAYSFASKMAFNYIKLVCQKYILATAAAQIIGDDKSQRSALINESIGTSSQLSNVALHSFLDYFTLAEPAKWGATIGMKFLEEKFKGQLSPEEREKYKGSDALNQDMMSGFADDIVQNIFENTAEAAKSNKEYGITNPETLRDDSRFLLLLSQMRYGIPGASIGNDLLKEMNKQRKMLESNSSNSDTLYK